MFVKIKDGNLYLGKNVVILGREVIVMQNFGLDYNFELGVNGGLIRDKILCTLKLYIGLYVDHMKENSLQQLCVDKIEHPLAFRLNQLHLDLPKYWYYKILDSFFYYRVD